MAGNIKGIKIEIDGDTQPLQKALKAINKESVNTTNELKQIDKALKFDTGNVILLTQKQEVLQKQVGITRDKLETLRQAQSKVDEEFKKGNIGSEQYRAFQREVEVTQNVLKGYEGKLASVTQALEGNGDAAKNNQVQLKELQNEQKLLASESEKVVSSFKLQESQLGANASESEKLALAQKKIGAQSSIVAKQIENLEKQLELTKKEYGENYYPRADEIVDSSLRHRTIDKVITDCFEQIVYSINQPTGARNFQSVFWNISYYDRFYFESLFGEFRFPDGSRPHWEPLSWLQKRFMNWFNQERTKCVLTFPVETMALLCKDGDVIDQEYADFTAEMYAKGHSFFTYMSDNADSLASCCRLRNEIQDNGFSYSLGAGGVSTGSKSVLTVNLNRCVQQATREGRDYVEYLDEIIDLMHKVQMAYNENLEWMRKRGLLPLFDAGYINIKRQYLTIGVNGMVEAAESLGITISDNEEYCNFVERILSLIESYNKKYRSKDLLFNCEMIPAENVGVKHARWDREDGYYVPRDCYNSYFYIVENKNTDPIEKFRLHGRRYIDHLTGGSALHCNLEEHLSQPQYRHLLRVAAVEGCNYFTFNIPNTLCNECGCIDKRYLTECPHCHSHNVDYLTRVIGYLKRVSNFSVDRQKEAARRYYGVLKPAKV